MKKDALLEIPMVPVTPSISNNIAEFRCRNGEGFGFFIEEGL